jgi:hypothetical protein
VEANARLTAWTGVALLLLFVAEVVTVLLSPRSVLTLHVTIGLILVPPVALKIATTTWRMVGYYRHDPEYREKGSPALGLRLLGPFLVFVTMLVLVSGIALVVISRQLHSTFLIVHKASFYLWLGAIGIHVAAHFKDMTRLVGRDVGRRSRNSAGVRYRLLAVSGSLVLGGIVATAFINIAEDYLRIHRFK